MALKLVRQNRGVYRFLNDEFKEDPEFILSSIGILTPAFMRHYRRHAIVFILFLSAFITPPDPISLIFMSIPLAILYEISIAVSWMVNRKK